MAIGALQVLSRLSGGADAFVQGITDIEVTAGGLVYTATRAGGGVAAWALSAGGGLTALDRIATPGSAVAGLPRRWSRPALPASRCFWPRAWWRGGCGWPARGPPTGWARPAPPFRP